MVYERYTGRMHGKLKAAADIYSKLIFAKVGELSDAVYLDTAEHFRSVPAEGWQPLEKGRRWGGEWQNMWVAGKAVVPAEAAGKKLYTVSNANAVEILFFVNGKPCGIFNSKNDFIGAMHSAELITADAKEGDVYDLAFECYAGHFCAGTAPYANYGRDAAPNAEFMRTYEGINLCVMDELVKDFVFDLTTLLQLAQRLPTNDFLRGKALNTLEKVYGALIQYPLHYSSEEWHASLAECREIMADALAHTEADKSRGYVGILGHSHMDTAWLWPISETIRKCARTYANALSLMEQYPEYKFIQSSALHLDWMRRYYPDIFEGIKRRTAEGRYEPNGGVWVECDCNITSGEAMVRQFLKGQRFTRKYLGYTSDCFWLPDTFGYNAAIPQIMRESDVSYFYTTKMSWNDLNSFPHDTFRWKGLDGSEVITHFNLMHRFPDADNIIGAVDSIRNKQVFDGKLLAYGFGDGGGGPTYGMLEQARRASDLCGMPEVETTTVSDFMKKIEAEAVNLPVYDGELYLELHRGTLTQMHDIKRNNRKAEIALHDMEFMAAVTGANKSACSDELWELLLKNQFHDILPGTSLTCVNDLARKEVTGIINDANAETARLADSILTDDNYITVFNSASFDRSDIVYLDTPIGQPFTDVMGRERYAADLGTIPALGAKSVEVRDLPADLSLKFDFDEDLRTVRTRHVTAKFDENGFIESLVDHASGREVRREGADPLNKFIICEDVPQNYDDWDIDADIAFKKPGKVELLSRKVVSCGAFELRIRSEYAIGRESILTQDMVFNAKSPRIDFHTKIDWKDKHSLLKVSFDVDVMSATAKHEIQFGHVDRPTTRNTSIEAAQFEVCNHKWTDISESRFGVALLNDCKYGISVEGSDMRLSLHRGGCRPDVTGDEGVHEVTYSLLPHTGAFGAENVVRPAYLLNYPVIVRPGKLASPVEPLIRIGESNIIAEAIKPAEDIENAYVVRLYECERCRTACEIALASDVKEAWVVNMLEEEKYRLDITDGKVKLDIAPFKIVTLMLKK